MTFGPICCIETRPSQQSSVQAASAAGIGTSQLFSPRQGGRLEPSADLIRQLER